MRPCSLEIDNNKQKPVFTFKDGLLHVFTYPKKHVKKNGENGFGEVWIWLFMDTRKNRSVKSKVKGLEFHVH
ncbi:hypothetical protein ASD24_13160 [Paenibacillus sp. Root52]|nr:hypothetical protein ASD24_13160 [Paenibacillus sp. Root52]